MTIMRGLRPYTAHTVTSPDRFRRALAVTRLTRVAVTRFELEAGACGVAVPVFGPGGNAAAAIELTVRDLGASMQTMLAVLTIAARSLTRELAGERQQAGARGAAMSTPRPHAGGLGRELSDPPQVRTYSPGPSPRTGWASLPIARRVDHRARVLGRPGGPVLPPRAGVPLGALAPLLRGRRHSFSAPVMCQTFGPGGPTMPAMCPPEPSTNRAGPLTQARRLVRRLPRHDVVVDRATRCRSAT